MNCSEEVISLGSYGHYYKNLPAQYSPVPDVVSVDLSSSRSLTEYCKDIPHIEEKSRKGVSKQARKPVRTLSEDKPKKIRRQKQGASSSTKKPKRSKGSRKKIPRLVLATKSEGSTEALTSMEDPTVTSHSSPRPVFSNPSVGRSSHSRQTLQIIPAIVSPPKGDFNPREFPERPVLDGDNSLIETQSWSAAYDDSLETGSLPDVLVDHIQVAVRMRPLQSEELFSPKRSLIQRPSKDSRAWTHHESTIVQKQAHRQISGKNLFSYDRVFGETTTNKRVYEAFGAPIVRAVLTGRHGTLFAYGQTGSGKTHTMQGTSLDEGIIARAAKDLFQHGGPHSRVTAQYFEIYNEVVRDLVADEPDEECTALPTLQVHESYAGVEVNGYTHLVSSVNDVLALLQRGQRNRASASTNVNAQSSRSHAIFRLKVERRTVHETFSSSLNLVDLAGSENASRSGTSGTRKREGAKINQSLLSLSRVIHALSLPERKRPKHIGYRNSKLTRILQPSLEGNACTAILCCASASRLNVEETRSTLKFAASAKRITVRPVINQVSNPKAEIAGLQRELAETRRALIEMQVQLNVSAKSEQSPVRGSSRSPRRPTTIVVRGSPPSSPERSFRATKAPSSPASGLTSPLAKGSIPDVLEVSLGKDMEQNSSVVSESRSEAVLFDDSGLSGSFFKQESSRQRDYVHQGHLSTSFMTGSEVSTDVPPVSEVVIMKSRGAGTNASPEAKLVDAEERARFLAGKLEATDSLVETLFDDLKHARQQNEDLLSLKSNIESRLQLLEHSKGGKSEDSEILIQQHILLKYAIYVGLVVYLCGWKEYFLAVIVFMWLSLEIIT